MKETFILIVSYKLMRILTNEWWELIRHFDEEKQNSLRLLIIFSSCLFISYFYAPKFILPLSQMFVRLFVLYLA